MADPTLALTLTLTLAREHPLCEGEAPLDATRAEGARARRRGDAAARRGLVRVRVRVRARVRVGVGVGVRVRVRVRVRPWSPCSVPPAPCAATWGLRAR